MRILLTNDDGIEAPGIKALYEAAQGLGDLHVVAPANAASAMSHAVTFHRDMRVDERTVLDEHGEACFRGFAVDGTPADCTKVAVTQLVPTGLDLVISGINAGANIGVNIIYSGTVAAAREAAIFGLPAIAVSLHIGDPRRTRWDLAARCAARVLRQVLAGPFESLASPAAASVLNINIPILDDGEEPREIRVVPMSISAPVDRYEADRESDTVQHLRSRTGLEFRDAIPDTDIDALLQRVVTVTPLHFDLTDRPLLETWRAQLR